MKVRFYFDYISPYARIAAAVAGPACRARGATFEAIPVVFGAILDAQKNVGPAEVEAKRPYVLKDAYRKAVKLGVAPIVPPPSHPFNPLVALRTTALANDAIRERVIEALYAEAWSHGRSIETADEVRAVVARVGAEASLVDRAAEPEAKALLRRNTEEAIAAGVFGVPTFVVGAELFFGVDALPFLDDYLAGKDPVPADLVERWRGLPATANRKR